MTESAFTFDCQGAQLVGILHRPDSPQRRGVLIVVGGGPQYRAGGHRQLTLWSRFLCVQGYPVFRFDYRGMGDSHGEFRGFEDVDTDIRAAIDRFFAAVPELEELVLWGECDAASAILFYAHRDPRIKGVVLLNPWVRTEAGEAKAILRFYYLHRLTQPSFWRKVFSLRFNPLASLKSALGLLQQSRSAATAGATDAGSRSGTGTGTGAGGQAIPRGLPLPERLLMGLERFKGPVMLVLSGRDLVAREFETITSTSPAWQQQFRLKPVTRHELHEGDHTFSSEAQRSQVIQWGLGWMRSW